MEKPLPHADPDYPNPTRIKSVSWLQSQNSRSCGELSHQELTQILTAFVSISTSLRRARWEEVSHQELPPNLTCIFVHLSITNWTMCSNLYISDWNGIILWPWLRKDISTHKNYIDTRMVFQGEVNSSKGEKIENFRKKWQHHCQAFGSGHALTYNKMKTA